MLARTGNLELEVDMNPPKTTTTKTTTPNDGSGGGGKGNGEEEVAGRLAALTVAVESSVAATKGAYVENSNSHAGYLDNLGVRHNQRVRR
jgi:hypothetical protein